MEYYEVADKSNNFRSCCWPFRSITAVKTFFARWRTRGEACFRGAVHGHGRRLWRGAAGYGCAPGNKVAVIGETSAKWIATYFAVVSGGGVIVPVDKELPDDEIAEVINDSGAVAVVFSHSYSGVIGGIKDSLANAGYFIDMAGGDAMSFDSLVERGKTLGGNGFMFVELDGDALSSLLYTSGTTGKSKGVMLTQRNILEGARGAVMQLRYRDTTMSVLPIHHSYEFTHGIVGSLMTGTTVCINDSLRNFAANLERFGPHMMFIVPAFAEMIYARIWQGAKASGNEQQLKDAIAKSNALLGQGVDRRAEFFWRNKKTAGRQP
jgi:long-chain acyl-CoA synthetase